MKRIAPPLLALLGCTGTPADMGRALLDVSPNPIQAVRPPIGEASQTPVLLRNVGSDPLEIRGVVLDGPSSLTLMAPSLPLELGPLEETTVRLGFRPQTLDPVSGALVIRSNDPSHAELRVPITAQAQTGAVLELCAESAAAGVAELCGGGALDLGSVSIGSERTATLRLKNHGNLSGRVTAINLEASSAELSLDHPLPPIDLRPGATLELTLRLRPTATGTKAATVTISLADGSLPSVRFTARGLSRALCVSPGQVDFGAVIPGSTATSTVEVESCDGRAVTLLSMQIEPSGSAFTISQTLSRPVLIDPGARYRVPLRFAPTSTGAAGATLRLQSDLGDAIAVLRGTGESCSLVLGATAFDFPSRGGAQELSLASSGGSCVVQIDRLDLSVGGGFSFVPPALPRQLTAAAPLMLELRYDGSARPRAAQGSLAISYQIKGTSAQASVALSAPAVPTDLACVGHSAVRWRDGWPQVPAPMNPGGTLARGSGVATAPCSSGEPVTVVSDGMEVHSAYAHAQGRYYFEATVESFVSGGGGFSSIGLTANPETLWGLWWMPAAARSYPVAAASVGYDAPGTISVAADLSAGRAYFFRDGIQLATQTLLLAPGVGAFHASAAAYSGDLVRLNFGAQPFHYAVPAGYGPWLGGPNGVCMNDRDRPAPAAAIEVDPPAPDLGQFSSFESRATEAIQLVALHARTTGIDQTWKWGLDGSGAPTQVSTSSGAQGSVLVDVQRPGRIVLALASDMPTEWVIVAGPQTEIVGAGLYGSQQALPFAGDYLTESPDPATDPYTLGGRWPGDFNSGDTQGFVSVLEARYCLPLKSYASAESARRFTLR